MMYFLVRNFLRLFLLIFMDFKVHGAERVPKKGAFILAGNHVSHLDPPAFSSASPRALCFMTRKTLLDKGVLGWVLSLCNTIPVRRDEADLAATRKAIRLLKSGKPIFIFPEGTRSETGEMADAQPGLGYLSLLSNTPILPAYVAGTDKAMPKGSHRIKFGQVSVYFGDLIEPQKLGLPSDRKEAAQKLADHVVEEIKRLGQAVKK